MKIFFITVLIPVNLNEKMFKTFLIFGIPVETNLIVFNYYVPLQ